ncbi:SET domain-containing protein [Endozoicomonas arenosclerae]|uniref:SET domain-containing protein n=1 Tax=Endozoicomonas arenosclerae TaxID=1633495 RepID=UPI0007849E44|nr:SET domain-containing protein [Endozoicomonas arenosclerae]
MIPPSQSDAGRPRRKRAAEQDVSHETTKRTHTAAKTGRGKQVSRARGKRRVPETDYQTSQNPVSSRPASILNPQCIRLSEFENFQTVQEARQLFQQQSRVIAGDSSAVVGQKGAIAARSFRKGEVIAFYEGKPVFRKKVPASVRWVRGQKLTKALRKQKLYVAWQREGEQIRFLARPDRHVAWSRATLFGTGIELGINGIEGGGPIAMINHSETPNAALKTLVDKNKLASGSRHAFQKLYLDSETFDQDSMAIAVYALKNISAGDEILGDYRQGSRDREEAPDFSIVGQNLLLISDDRVTVDGFNVYFSRDRSFSAPITVADAESMEVEESSDSLPESESLSLSDEFFSSLSHDSMTGSELASFLEETDDPFAMMGLSQKALTEMHRLFSGETGSAQEYLRIIREEVKEDQTPPFSALKAYLFLMLLRHMGSKRALNTIASAFMKMEPIGPYGTKEWPWSSDTVFQMFLDHELLGIRELFELMPLTWLKEHPEHTEAYICQRYLSGRVVNVSNALNQFEIFRGDGTPWTPTLCATMMLSRNIVDFAAGPELERMLTQPEHRQDLYWEMRFGSKEAFCRFFLEELERHQAEGFDRSLGQVFKLLKLCSLELRVGSQLFEPCLDAAFHVVESEPEKHIAVAALAKEKLQQYEQNLIDRIVNKTDANNSSSTLWLDRIKGDRLSIARKRSPDLPAKILRYFLQMKKVEENNRFLDATVKALSNNGIPKFHLSPDDPAYVSKWGRSDIKAYMEAVEEVPDGFFGRQDQLT